MILLDTCALLEWTLGCVRPFSSELRRRLAAGPVAVCAISFGEIACKHALGRLDLGGPDPAQFLASCRRLALRILDARADDWVAAAALDWLHRDPADRLIVAVAKAASYDLATIDQRMPAVWPRCIW